MGVAKNTKDVDTHTYWTDVTDALREVCELSAHDARSAVEKMRKDLTGLSEWGQLLAYHDSVPQVAEDLWTNCLDVSANEREVEHVRRELVQWYSARNRARGLTHGPADLQSGGKTSSGLSR